MDDKKKAWEEAERSLIPLRKEIMRLAFALCEEITSQEQSELLLQLKQVTAESHRQSRVAGVLMREWHAYTNLDKERIAEANRQANLEAMRAKGKRMQLETLEAKSKTREIVQEGVRLGIIAPINETPEQKAVNRQRRSNGGVIRIESGDGK